MNLKSLFSPARRAPPRRIVIAGGGLAGVFSAYEVLHQALQADYNVHVTLVADRIQAPSAAGSHVVLDHGGLYDQAEQKADSALSDHKRRAVSTLFRDGYNSLAQTIAREGIDCSFTRGYEWKAQTAEELRAVVNAAIAHKMYRPDEFDFNTQHQYFNLPGYPHSVHFNTIGQVNVLSLVRALVMRIRSLGGHVLEGERYEAHTRDANGAYLIRTSERILKADEKPLLATGALHLRTLPGFSFETKTLHTMSVVFGPLSTEDRARLSSRPMAFSDINLSGDVLWGGLDDKGHFTIGRGENDDQGLRGRDMLMREIYGMVSALYPGIVEHYIPRITYGATMVAKNHLPIVGRTSRFDVMGAWGGEGIVAGYAAAKAYGAWMIHKDDKALQTFESLQPDSLFPAMRPRQAHALNVRPPHSQLG